MISSQWSALGESGRIGPRHVGIGREGLVYPICKLQSLLLRSCGCCSVAVGVVLTGVVLFLLTSGCRCRPGVVVAVVVVVVVVVVVTVIVGSSVVVGVVVVAAVVVSGGDVVVGGGDVSCCY